MLELLAVGKIINTHGVKGEVKVEPLTDDPRRFEDLEWVYVSKNIDANDKNTLKKIKILNVKYFKNTVILKLKDIEDIDIAISFKNHFLLIDRENAIELPENTFFIFELIGCEVYEENDNLLGKVKDVIQTGSNDVYVVKNASNKEILIPAIKSVVKNISIENKKIVVQIPEGLIDDEVWYLNYFPRDF